jgi:hypothetical protein
VKTGDDPEIAKQGYRLVIAPDRVDILGNSDQGLFCGVQTLVQLLKPGHDGKLALPAGTIEDWPALRLRFLHWDTKHHQDRIETLKRYLDWSARFKVDMIGFELEDKFSYPAQTREEAARGMNQLVYTSMQGVELLFPNNYAYESGGRLVSGRLTDTYDTLAEMAKQGRPIGAYGAAWDDSGLHGDAFWLGWSTVAQYSWQPGGITIDQHIADFGNVFYGPGLPGVSAIYRDMQRQARFFEESWDEIPSRVRSRAYGNSEGKGVGGERTDLTLPAPALPSLPHLDYQRVYSGRYSDLVARARQMALEGDALVAKLHEALLTPNRNPYNLEVFLSIALLTRHQARMIVGLESLEDGLSRAQERVRESQPAEAAEMLAGVCRIGRSICEERKQVFAALERTWEKGRFPKGREVAGRRFVHVMDDTKDHWVDRRSDLKYMMAPEESIGLDAWVEKLEQIRKAYANDKGVAQGER